jgi:hypothetical protein
LGLINGVTNPAKCRLAINERVDAIARTYRVGAGGDKWNMSHSAATSSQTVFAPGLLSTKVPSQSEND